MKIVASVFMLVMSLSVFAEVSIEPIDFSEIVEHNANTRPVAFFGPSQTQYNAWNHTANGDVYSGLAQALEHYDFKLLYAKQPHSTPILDGILVKKLGDWSQQHSTGLEFSPESDIAFKDVKALEMIIAIDPSQSFIPSQSKIKADFGKFTDEKTLQEYAKSEINISLALYAYFSDDTREPSYNAEYLLALAPENHSKGYLSVTIPIEQFRLYTEQNYASTDIQIDDFSDRLVEGIRMMGESSNKKVLRNYNGDIYEAQSPPPELFKEVGISLFGLYLR
jgi:hypothetical protein